MEEEVISSAVQAAIEALHRRLPPSASRDAGLAALRRGAPAVVTGQQVGLFLGPLFTLYKAATAVKAARAMDAVPVFWLQTEDHDLAEIAEHWVMGGVEPVAVRLPAPDTRVSISELTLPDEVGEALAKLGALVGDWPEATAHLERLARHYRAGARWADAFAGVLAELLPELVFVEPRDLAAEAAPVHRRAIEEAAEIAGELAPGPIHVRPGAPLSFVHPRGAAGPRYRLDGELAEVGGEGRHTRASLLRLLAEDPRAFSSSALLRPIVQDTLLPTIAYVGGPAEVQYLPQVAPLYPRFGLTPPRILPRARFRLVDRRAERILEKLHLRPDDATRPEAELLAAHVPAEDATSRMLAAFDAACPAELAADKAAGRIREAIGRLGEKHRQLLARQDHQLVESVRRLKAFLHPREMPQERVYGLSSFARHGDAALVEKIVAAVDPPMTSSDAALKDLHL